MTQVHIEKLGLGCDQLVVTAGQVVHLFTLRNDAVIRHCFSVTLEIQPFHVTYVCARGFRQSAAGERDKVGTFLDRSLELWIYDIVD